MSDSFLDSLPSRERSKWERLKLRSPAEYAWLREKVRERGPEYAKDEMKRNAEFAEVKLHLETEPSVQEQAKDVVATFIDTQGMDAALEGMSASAKEALKKGQFEVAVDVSGKEPKLAVKPTTKPKEKHGSSDAPMGNVAEVYPLKAALQQQVMASLKVGGGIAA
ncbi:MAG: hypothetical protein PHZ00_03305 [Candidatus Peribacteraceae bacterium]|nr:hypothetical protein [Candidatus Peribacteraceae bacterium]